MRSIKVAATRPDAGTLLLDYRLDATLGRLRIPQLEIQERSDELWRHSCFEAFVEASRDEGYYELNLAPSTRWAAYRFDSYRAGMRDARGIPAPLIEVRGSTDALTMRASIMLDSIADDPHWNVALSAVIEDQDGQIFYWALAHPPGKADFHHPIGFDLALERPGPA